MSKVAFTLKSARETKASTIEQSKLKQISKLLKEQLPVTKAIMFIDTTTFKLAEKSLLKHFESDGIL